MYVIRMRIKQTEYFDALAGKRFALINKCHNVLVKHCIHLLNRLKHDRQYRSLLDEYHGAKAGSREAKAIGRKMNEFRAAIGLSISGLESYISKWQGQHSDHLSSHQAQKEARRVMDGVEDVVFGKGKELHFRKLSDAGTLCSKSPNGLRFDRESMTFRWMKDTFSLKPIGKGDMYMISTLYPDGEAPLPISYCEIKRMMFPNGWHYYLNVYVKGTAPKKHAVGAGRAGIDPGTSTMAVSAENKAMLRELAPGVERYAGRQKRILKAMDRSRRDSNPDNFNPDGTAIKGRKAWHKSKRYRKLERCYKSLCRQKALFVRQSHCVLANEVLEEADDILVEHMDYKALQRRARKTERQDKESAVHCGKGKIRLVRKHKCKRRFGKSLESRAPSEFLTILKQKVESAGGRYNEIDTKAFKASQYDHSDGSYAKAPLGTRMKTIDGTKVQRDLYSAFLIQHSNSALDSPDRAACIGGFKKFVELQNKEIRRIIASGQKRPACFGF